MAYLRKQSTTGDLIDATSRIQPHIQTAMLYPAVGGVLLDGSTATSATTVGPNNSVVASSKYGTVQADGRMYYYTELPGSPPLVDPRVGTYYGSQRFLFRSLQRHADMTAGYGKIVDIVDGRPFIRIWSETDDCQVHMTASSRHEECFRGDTAAMEMDIEVIGYFSQASFMCHQNDTNHLNDVDTFIDGSIVGDGVNYGGPTNAPFEGGFWSCHANSILTTGTVVLGIHTLRIHCQNTGSNSGDFQGIELVASDPTSSTTQNQIQIQNQNVVSFNRKWNIPATAPHYDPFNGFTNSTDLHSQYVDTATSLGLSSAVALHGASWAISGTNNIRPYNGARVVRWVDKDGSVKISVNVMPPNAQNIATTAFNEIATPSATNIHTVAFSDDAVDNSLAEVAGAFIYSEFGNGARNLGAVSAHADASRLNSTSDNINFCLNDGLTSLQGKAVVQNGKGFGGIVPAADGSWINITWIGTGIRLYNIEFDSNFDQRDHVIAQNLPYGSHIIRMERNADDDPDFTIDGRLMADHEVRNYGSLSEVSFMQPKMPPIPEDACIIADYMLMADFVAEETVGTLEVSKGVRILNPSRDIRVNTSGDDSDTGTPISLEPGGYRIEMAAAADSGTSATFRVPSFCTNFVHRGHQSQTLSQLAIGTTLQADGVTTKDNTDADGSFSSLTTSLAPAYISIGHNPRQGQLGSLEAYELAIPTHTSSHYQRFESPLFKSIVGGDRNMEQTNLICSPDGKTWDDVSRNKTYLQDSKLVLMMRGDPNASNDTDNSQDTLTHFEDCRGLINNMECFIKDWALADDMVICLTPGYYRVVFDTSDANGGDAEINIGHGKENPAGPAMQVLAAADRNQHQVQVVYHFSRYDHVRIEGGVQNGVYVQFFIERL